MPSPLDAILNPGVPQLKSPWANLAAQQAQPRGYIGGQNGENVMADYQAGGKYSSYNAPPTSSTVMPSYRTGVLTSGVSDQNLQTLASGGQSHLQAWTSGNASPVKIQGPFEGMPQNLAATAQGNLSQEDARVSAFNDKAKMFAWGSAHSASPAIAATPAIAAQPAVAARPTFASNSRDAEIDYER